MVVGGSEQGAGGRKKEEGVGNGGRGGKKEVEARIQKKGQEAGSRRQEAGRRKQEDRAQRQEKGSKEVAVDSLPVAGLFCAG